MYSEIVQRAVDCLSLVTCEGDWHAVGNTVYFHDEDAQKPYLYVAMPGAVDRAQEIAAMPALISDLINSIRELEKENAGLRSDVERWRDAADRMASTVDKLTNRK
jgi:hypothetical protein